MVVLPDNATAVSHRAAHRRIFRRFLLGHAAALLATSVGQVATAWWITIENGARDLTIYSAVAAAVACVAIPSVSTVGDRYEKRALIQLGLGIYLVTGLMTALVAACDVYDIRILVALESVGLIGLALFSPTASVIATDMLPASVLSEGLQRQKLYQSIGQLAGPLIGGGALAYGGVKFALWMQVALLALAFVVIRLLPAVLSARAQDVRHSWLRDLAAGVRAKWDIALERNWTLISFFVGICFMPSLGMLLPLKIHAMQLEGKWLGFCEAAASLGLLLGAAIGLSARLITRMGRYRLRFVAATVLGPAMVLVGFSSSPVVLLGSLLLVGSMNSLVVMMGYSRRILAVPHSFRTRMTAVNMMLNQLAGVVGPAVAGVLLLHVSITAVYVIFGVALVACSFGNLLTPAFREFMSLADDELEGWYGVRYPQAFGARAVASEGADSSRS